MKQHIEKLTEEQAKALLELAMEALERSVYAESHTSKMTAAERLGMLRHEIESTAKSNEK